METVPCASNFHSIREGEGCVRKFITSKGCQPLGIVRKSAIGLVAAGALFAVVGQAGAQSPQPVSSDPVVVVKEREKTMKSMGDAMKKISAYVKNEGGTIDGVREGAATIQQSSHKIVPILFPANTGMGTVKDSAAKPEIWKQWPQFQQAAQKLESTSAELVTVATSDDRAAIAKQFGQVGQSCGGCHDNFRQKKE
jgi:cytochrome c556